MRRSGGRPVPVGLAEKQGELARQADFGVPLPRRQGRADLKRAGLRRAIHRNPRNGCGVRNRVSRRADECRAARATAIDRGRSPDRADLQIL